MELGRAIEQPTDGKATAGNLEQVLMNMAEHRNSCQAQIKGLRSLQMFLNFGQQQQLAVSRARGAASIVAAMRDHANDPTLLCHAALTLTSLVQGCEEAQAAALAAGAAEATVTTLKSITEPEELQATCAAALASLSQGNKEGAQKVLSVGGAEALVAVLRGTLPADTDGSAFQRCCEALALLLASGTEAFRLPWSEVAEAIVGVLVLLPAEPDVQIAACWALEELVKVGASAGAAAICDADAAPLLVAAMKQEGAKAGVLDGCCRLVAAVARAGSPSHKALLAAGAAAATAAAIDAAIARGAKAPKAATRSLRLALAALEALAVDADSAARAAEDGARAAVAATAWSLSRDDADLRQRCLRTLRSLSAGEQGLRAVLQAGGLEPARQAVQKGGQDEDERFIEALLVAA